jgi:hypothetical protein
MPDPLLDRVLVFHTYADCPGVIRSVGRSVADPNAPAGMLTLICTECGATVGAIEAGLLDQFLSLIEERH